MTAGRRTWPQVGAAVALLACVTGAVFVLWPTAPSKSAERHAAPYEVALPDPVEPAFRVPDPKPLRRDPYASRWAPVLRSVTALAHPGGGLARAVLDKTTPEGTTNIAAVLGSATDSHGRLWAHVRLATLPNNLTGWVPRDALGGYATVRTHLVIDRDRLTATLYRGKRAIFRADVGIGRAAAPTPAGEFYVRNKLTEFSNPAYGPVAFGTSARSDVLTDWPAGGFIGIHGTDEPELLPGRVSHGCIRLRNEDILRLARLMPVGTPLTIR